MATVYIITDGTTFVGAHTEGGLHLAQVFMEKNTRKSGANL